MATKYVVGKGSVFSISVDGGTTYVPVKQIKTISFSGGKSDLEDVTNMDSTGAYREFAPTLLDAGSAALSGVMQPSDPGQLVMASAFTSQTLVKAKLQYPIATGQTVGFLRSFYGYIQDSNIDAQFDKASTLSATIKITGPFTDTPGS